MNGKSRGSGVGGVNQWHAPLLPPATTATSTTASISITATMTTITTTTSTSYYCYFNYFKYNYYFHLLHHSPSWFPPPASSSEETRMSRSSLHHRTLARNQEAGRPSHPAFDFVAKIRKVTPSSGSEAALTNFAGSELGCGHMSQHGYQLSL